MSTQAYQSPSRQCDLVLKGGITSGLVYPAAVLELAKTYRFICIAGTSAGAIAAALTAAAEYGRHVRDGEGNFGFDRLSQIDNWLAGDGHLFGLFQPSDAAAPLFGALLALNEKQKKTQRSLREQEEKTRQGKDEVPETRKPERSLMKALRFVPGILRQFVSRAYWMGAVVGAALGTLLGAIFFRGIWPSLPWLALAGIALLTVGLALGWLTAIGFGLARLVRILLTDVQRGNFFGMCSGRKGPIDQINDTVLTDWLVAKINVLAGRTPEDPPLTFAELSQSEAGTDATGAPIGITLRMVTTNLSHQQPYVVPFAEDIFIFNLKEWEQFFPPSVIDHLKGARADGKI